MVFEGGGQGALMPERSERCRGAPGVDSSPPLLGFGGFLGLGNDHYPLPWQSLKYDTELGGYRTGVTESQLRGAPKYRSDTDWNWGDTDRNRTLNDYYGVPVF